mgnify:CR=1 FL=1
MTRLPLTCTSCGVALRGELDTFGEVDQPMCWSCWANLEFPEDVNWYPFIPLDVRQLYEKKDVEHGFDENQNRPVV